MLAHTEAELKAAIGSDRRYDAFVGGLQERFRKPIAEADARQVVFDDVAALAAARVRVHAVDAEGEELQVTRRIERGSTSTSTWPVLAQRPFSSTPAPSHTAALVTRGANGSIPTTFRWHRRRRR